MTSMGQQYQAQPAPSWSPKILAHYLKQTKISVVCFKTNCRPSLAYCKWSSLASRHTNLNTDKKSDRLERDYLAQTKPGRRRTFGRNPLEQAEISKWLKACCLACDEFQWPIWENWGPSIRNYQTVDPYSPHKQWDPSIRHLPSDGSQQLHKTIQVHQLDNYQIVDPNSGSLYSPQRQLGFNN